MKSKGPILAAVDFSSSSEMVLVHAAKLAAASDRALLAIHVVSEGQLKDWEETMGVEAGTADHVKEVTDRLNRLVRECCGKVPTGISIRIGRPYRVMREIAAEQGADLLVLGAHDVARRRLGPVASHCARALPLDVLILRDWQGGSVQRVAACVDFTRIAAAALDRAIEMAGAHQASLEIIHVVFPPSRDPWGRVLDQRLDDEVGYQTAVHDRARSRMEAFLEPFRERLADITPNIVYLEGESPAAAIAAHVEAEKIDLTAIGARTGSWMEEFVLGSTTERLMNDSTSSVLIAREREA
jgi:universal stress protein E